MNINELLLINVNAAGVKNPQMVSSMIMTFASGLSLKLNVMKPEQLEDEVKALLLMLRNLKTAFAARVVQLCLRRT